MLWKCSGLKQVAIRKRVQSVVKGLSSNALGLNLGFLQYRPTCTLCEIAL